MSMKGLTEAFQNFEKPVVDDESIDHSGSLVVLEIQIASKAALIG